MIRLVKHWDRACYLTGSGCKSDRCPDRVVVDPAVLPVVVPFVDEPVVVPLAASPPAAELPPAEPVPFCASANEPVSANVAANAIVASFVVASLVLSTKDNSPSTSSVPLVFSAMEPAKPLA